MRSRTGIGGHSKHVAKHFEPELSATLTYQCFLGYSKQHRVDRLVNESDGPIITSRSATPDGALALKTSRYSTEDVLDIIDDEDIADEPNDKQRTRVWHTKLTESEEHLFIGMG